MSSSSSPDRTPDRTPRPAPRATLLAVGAAVALALGACGVDDDNEVSPDAPSANTGPAAPSAHPTPSDQTGSPDTTDGPRYVALGDSFAAFGPTAAPTSGPPACLRSTLNYPAVLAGSIDGVEFVDATCGGARTPDMTGRQIAETPPQLDALTPGTDLVTLSIGGNDIGFGDIVRCVLTTPARDGAPCRDRLEATVTEALDALPASLDAVYAGIRERSPEARIITTAYMPLVPADGGCGFVAAMAPGDVTWTRYVTERINLHVADAAARAGADVVQPADAEERNACATADRRYTDFTGIETGSHPMHPTALGQAAMAEAVAGAL